MKSIITAFVILGLIALASFSQADSNYGYNGNPAAVVGTTIFSNYSAANGTAVTSPVISTGFYRVKTAQVQGIAVSGHSNTTLSGTLGALCAINAGGPFQACTGLYTTAIGGAVSTTSNAILTWTDASPYVEFSWTKTAGEVSVWMSLGN